MITPISHATHIPVMLSEVLESLQVAEGKIFLDGTFGGGGYSRAILAHAACAVYAVDRDHEAINRGRALMNEYPGRFEIRHGNFADMDTLYPELSGRVDGIALDIGPSSFQLDETDRGFSFRLDAPLDMRMDTSCGETAADVVNTYDAAALLRIIFDYGEERYAKRIVRKIIEARTLAPIKTTKELADLVRSVYPYKKDAIDPATKTFQALRIHVNKELEALEKGLDASLKLLKDAGRLVVVTFHSLEDRLVKRFFDLRSGKKDRQVSRHMLIDPDKKSNALLKIITKSPVCPSDGEVLNNRRSRSAKMRVAERTIKE